MFRFCLLSLPCTELCSSLSPQPSTRAKPQPRTLKPRYSTLHREAQRLSEAQEVRRVSAELRSLAEGGVPSEAAAAEARDVHQQLAAELSRLSLAQSELDLRPHEALKDASGPGDQQSPSRPLRRSSPARIRVGFDAPTMSDPDLADASTRFEPTDLSAIRLSLRDSFETLQQMERQLAASPHTEVPAEEALRDAAADALRITTLLRRFRHLKELLGEVQGVHRQEAKANALGALANFGLKSDKAVQSGKLLISSEMERLRSLSDLLDQRSRVSEALRPMGPAPRSMQVSKRIRSSTSGFNRRNIHQQLQRSWRSSLEMDGYIRDQLRCIQEARSRLGPRDLKCVIPASCMSGEFVAHCFQRDEKRQKKAAVQNLGVLHVFVQVPKSPPLGLSQFSSPRCCLAVGVSAVSRMGRGHPGDFLLPPIDKAAMTSPEPRQKATKPSSVPPLPSVSSGFVEDSSERQRSARPARFRPAATDLRNEDSAPSPQPPPHPPKGRAPRHPYLLDASLKGFCWRTSFEKIRPSAEKADKVYFAPVVPGVPCPRKGRRPRRQNGGMLPLQTYTIQPPLRAPASSVPREKVLSTLRTALAAEGLPEDAASRVIDAVDEAFEEEAVELIPKPASKVDDSFNHTPQATEDESPSAPTEAPPVEDPVSELEAPVEPELSAQPEVHEEPAEAQLASETADGGILDEARCRMDSRLREALEAESIEAAAEREAASAEARLRMEAKLLTALEDGTLQEAVPSTAAADEVEPAEDAAWDVDFMSDDEVEVVEDVADEVLTSVFSFAVGKDDSEPHLKVQGSPERHDHGKLVEGKLEFNASTNKWVRRGAP
ncbi:unnamed protein product [Symbiodinium microadriaticum]|nr:unnamed protein product [Symbiodinium sp. KB8]CAE7866170.1 unnamed protein product [Symbiodinium microadriaticum]